VSVTENLKVLHVVTDRDRRGAQVFATDLAQGLEAIGVTSTVVALTSGDHDDLLPIDALGPGPRSASTLRELRRTTKSFDVVVAHGSSTLIACAVALFGTRVPFVYRQISDPLFWAASWPRRLRVALFLRRAAAIVALAESSSDVVCRHYWLSRSRVTVIPNAVPSAHFATATAEQRRAAREHLGLTETGTVALYIGALAPEKGVDLAIEAVTDLPDVHLMVVGAGPELKSLHALSERAAPGRVHFPGPLEDPVPAMHAADMIVLASRGGDSMPAVLIEAGLCGLAAVSTPVGAITDVVVHGETGLIAAVGDQDAITSAMRQLVTDAQLRSQFGESARERCLARFTIEATAPDWAQLLVSVRRIDTGRRASWRQRST
jgi:glycosyltransferase involved in cell wall biosynthesis